MNQLIYAYPLDQEKNSPIGGGVLIFLGLLLFWKGVNP
jgi:hypothetical protein